MLLGDLFRLFTWRIAIHFKAAPSRMWWLALVCVARQGLPLREAKKSNYKTTGWRECEFVGFDMTVGACIGNESRITVINHMLLSPRYQTQYPIMLLPWGCHALKQEVLPALAAGLPDLETAGQSSTPSDWLAAGFSIQRGRATSSLGVARRELGRIGPGLCYQWPPDPQSWDRSTTGGKSRVAQDGRGSSPLGCQGGRAHILSLARSRPHQDPLSLWGPSPKEDLTKTLCLCGAPPPRKTPPRPSVSVGPLPQGRPHQDTVSLWSPTPPRKTLPRHCVSVESTSPKEDLTKALCLCGVQLPQGRPYHDPLSLWGPPPSGNTSPRPSVSVESTSPKEDLTMTLCLCGAPPPSGNTSPRPSVSVESTSPKEDLTMTLCLCGAPLPQGTPHQGPLSLWSPTPPRKTLPWPYVSVGPPSLREHLTKTLCLCGVHLPQGRPYHDPLSLWSPTPPRKTLPRPSVSVEPNSPKEDLTMTLCLCGAPPPSGKTLPRPSVSVESTSPKEDLTKTLCLCGAPLPQGTPHQDPLSLYIPYVS